MNTDTSAEGYVTPHYPLLDAIRGVAILAVLLYHYFDNNPIFRWGWMGVDLFFVLSGFLITANLLRARGHANYYTNFYARRVLRTFPLYYLTLAAFFFGGSYFFTQQQPGSTFYYYQQHQIWFWTFTQNWLPLNNTAANTPYLLHLWSLAVEEQFYLLWPVLVGLCSSTHNLQRMIMILCLVAFSYRFFIYNFNAQDYSSYYHNTVTRADSLMAGAYLAVLHHAGKKLMPVVLWTIPLLWVVSLLATISLFGNIHPTNWLMGSIGYSLTAITFMLLLYKLISVEAKSTKVLQATFLLRQLGRISYSVYLFHLPVLFVVGKVLTGIGDMPSYYIKMASLVVTLLLSTVTYFYIEKPFQALKTYFQ